MLKLPCRLSNDRDGINGLAETARGTTELIRSTSAQSINLVQGVDSKVCALAVSMKSDVQSSRDEVLHQIHVQNDNMTNDITRQLKEHHSRIQDALSTGLGQNNDLVTSLRERVATSDQVDQISQRVHDLSLAFHEQAHAGAGQVDELKCMFQASPLFNQAQRPVSSETLPNFAPSSTTIMSGTASGRPLLCDILRDLFIVLSSDLADAFTRALVALIRHVHSLIYVWPKLLLLWRVMQRLPPTISLVLHDNITFEDVLGRIHSLQYQQFKHWRVFKESLAHSFKGLPGSRKVRTGQFRLTNAKVPDKVYDKSNWSRMLQPGSSLVMSIKVEGLSHDYHQCPRCETRVSGATERRNFCVGCQLHWEICKPAEKSDNGSQNRSVNGIRRKQARQGKRNVAEPARELLGITNESPDEWLFRHGVFPEPMTSSGRISPRRSMRSGTLRHLHARRKGSQCVNELMSFKRIHVKEPAAKLENVVESKRWEQSAEAVEGDQGGWSGNIVWVHDDEDPRRIYPQVVENVARSRQVCIYLVVEALLVIQSYLAVASDLNTQRLSRQ
jgi:hypothetical protein